MNVVINKEQRSRKMLQVKLKETTPKPYLCTPR